MRCAILWTSFEEAVFHLVLELLRHSLNMLLSLLVLLASSTCQALVAGLVPTRLPCQDATSAAVVCTASRLRDAH